MSKPLIQINDLVREMTDEEHAAYLEMQAQLQAQLQPLIPQTDE